MADIKYENILKIKGEKFKRANGKQLEVPYWTHVIDANQTSAVGVQADGNWIAGLVWGKDVAPRIEINLEGLDPKLANLLRTLMGDDEDIAQLFLDKTGKTSQVSFDPKKGTIKIENTAEIHKVPPFKCTITPAGFVLEIGDEKYSHQVPKLEVGANLSTMYSPEAIESMLDRNNPLLAKKPTMSSIDPQLIDLYIKQTKPENPSHIEIGSFVFNAVPDGNGGFYYLAKDDKGKNYICDGKSFKVFDNVSLIEKDGKHYLAFPHKTKEKTETRYIEDIPGLTEKITSFVYDENTYLVVQPGNSTNLTSQINSTIKPRKVAVEGIANEAVVTEQPPELPPERPPEQPPELPPERKNRVNPYVKPKTEELVKKKPMKFDKNIILYGGLAIGTLLLLLAFAFPAVAWLGSMLFTMAAVTYGAAFLITANIDALNNPMNQLGSAKYKQLLAQKEVEAQATAEKFWEKEIEFENVNDNYKELYQKLMQNEENCMELFQFFQDKGLMSPADYAMFMRNGNLDQRNAFSTSMKEIMELMGTDTSKMSVEDLRELEALKQEKMVQFLKDFGLVKEGATAEEIETARKLVFENPDLQAMAKPTLQNLDNFNGVEDRRNKLHNEISDTLQNCSKREFEIITTQPGFDLDTFIEEHPLDIARRFMYRNDITQMEMEEFFGKLKPETIQLIEKSMTEIEHQHGVVIGLAHSQEAREKNMDRAKNAIQVMRSLSGRETDKTQQVELLTPQQLANRTKNMLWAICLEDIQRTEIAVLSEGSRSLYFGRLEDLTSNQPKIEFQGSPDSPHMTAYLDLLHKRAEILNNPVIHNVLTRHIMMAPELSPLVGENSMADVKGTALVAILQTTLQDPSLPKGERKILEDAVKTLSLLDEENEDASDDNGYTARMKAEEDIKADAERQLCKSLNMEVPASLSDEDLRKLYRANSPSNPSLGDEFVDESIIHLTQIYEDICYIIPQNVLIHLTETYPECEYLTKYIDETPLDIGFKPIDDDLTKKYNRILTLYCHARSKIETTTSAQTGATGENVSGKPSLNQLDAFVRAVYGGSYVDATLYHIEHETFKDDATKAFNKPDYDHVDIMPRASTRDELLATNKFLAKHGVKPEDRRVILERASKLYADELDSLEDSDEKTIKRRKGLQPEHIAKAMLELNQDVEIVDCSTPGVTRKVKLSEILARTAESIEEGDESDRNSTSPLPSKRTLNFAEEDVENLRTSSQEDTKRKVEAVGNIIGQDQATYAYRHADEENAERRAPSPVNEPGLSKKEKEARQAEHEELVFLTKANRVLNTVQETKVSVREQSSPLTLNRNMTELQNQMIDLIGRAEAMKIFKGAKIEGIESWNQLFELIENNQLTTERFKKIEGQIKGVIKKKAVEKKKNTQKKREKAKGKDKKKNKIKGSPAKSRKQNRDRVGAAVAEVKEKRRNAEHLAEAEKRREQANQQQPNQTQTQNPTQEAGAQ